MLKEDFKNPISELIKDLENHVKKITGYEIKLLEKDTNEDIKVPDDYIFLTSDSEQENKIKWINSNDW